MNSTKRIEKIAGILFLTAMAASLLGGGLLESVLNTPDYLTNVSANTTPVKIGMLLEFVNGIAVAGIAIILFPVLKHYNESLSYGYLGIRIMESVFCIFGAIIPLSIIILSKEYLQADISQTPYILTLGTFFISIRAELTELLVPLFFGLEALLFYFLLYRSKLIPRFISVWGFAGSLFILILIFLEAGTIINLIFVLPIILNEIFLGIWLITKGFSSYIIVSGTAEKL